MKKLLVLLTVLSLPVMLFAGGGKQAQDTNNLRVTWWGNTVRDAGTLKVIELFKSKNPGVTIEPETTGWGGYWERLNTQIAANNVPDVIQHSTQYIVQWVSRNQLLDMGPYLNDGTINKSKISNDALAAGMVNGKVYGINIGTNAHVMLYDPAIVAQAGLPPIDSTKWTWKDFEQIALTIYQKTGVQTMPGGGQTVIENITRQSGNPIYSADGRAMGFTDPTVLREYFEMQLRLLDAGALYDPEEGLLTVAMEEEPFSKGKAWNVYRWSNQFIATEDAAGRVVEGGLHPRIANFKQNGTYFHAGCYLSIASSTANPKLAAQFVDFFTNNIEANEILGAERGVPIPDDVRSYLAGKVDPRAKKVFDFIDLVSRNMSPAAPPDPPGSGECEAILNNISAQILTKKISAADGVAQYMARSNQILSGSF